MKLRAMLLWCLSVALVVSVCRSEDTLQDLSGKERLLSYLENYAVSAATAAPKPLMVGLTLIHGADAKGAGTAP